jgi:predicted dehydrogenase
VERSSEIRRLRVGVVGCGLVAQVMHLPYLGELPERFEVVSLCDISPRALAYAGSLFPEARRHARWQDVLADEPEAVMVLTPGSHAPIAIAAAQAGQHVFVEKPMCITAEEGHEMLDAAAAAGVVLMVGYMKRYDPAYEELARLIDLDGVGFARITTLESPLEPYVAHYPLADSSDVDPALLDQLAADDAKRVAAALPDADDLTRRVYRAVLLDSMVHELNGVRGLLGEPTELHFARIRAGAAGVTASLSFGDVDCAFIWLDLPGIARYEQDWAFYGSQARATLRFPSPFLRSEPTRLVLEGGELGTASSWRTVKTVSYDEAFKRELVEFHDAVSEGRPPRTDGEDGLRDVLLCQAIARAHTNRLPLVAPTTEVASR